VNLHFLLPPTLGLPRTTALAELLEASLRGSWHRPVRVEVAQSYRDLERAVLGGGVDLAWAPPVLCGRAEPSARLILQAIRGGRSTYRAALIGRRSDHLHLADLAGKRAAWVDPFSAAGYLLPRALLRSRGLDPDATLGAQRFAGSYRDALLALVAGTADVAPIFAGDGDEEGLRSILADQIGPEARLLAPFALTAEAPTDGLVVTARLDPATARELASLLLPGDGTPPPGFLLDVCEAEGFVVAAPGLYGSFVSSVSPPERE
jgi:phosphonate transport system substrate-binding protein